MKEISKTKEMENCTFVKTILMIVIVFYHSILFWSGTWFSAAGKPVFSCPMFKVLSVWLNSFHIYAFSLVSGYIFYFLKAEKEKYAKFFNFLLKKSKRLLVPYIFVSLMWVIPIRIRFENVDYFSATKDVLLGIKPEQLWFLLMLFVCFLVAFFIYPFIVRQDKIGSLSLILLVICTGGGGQFIEEKIPNYFQFLSVLKHLPVFVLGMKLRQNGSAFRKISCIAYIICDIVLCTFILFLKTRNQDMIAIMVIRAFVNTALHIIGALMAFFMLQKLGASVSWKNNKFFSFFQNRSMPVYLFHQQVIYFSIIFFNGRVNPYVNAGLNFVCAISVSLLISSVMLKFKATRFLIGEK